MAEFDIPRYINKVEALSLQTAQEQIPSDDYYRLAQLIKMNRGPVFTASWAVQNELYLNVVNTIREGGHNPHTSEYVIAQEKVGPLSQKQNSLRAKHHAYGIAANPLARIRMLLDQVEFMPLTYSDVPLPTREKIVGLESARKIQLHEYAIEAYSINPSLFVEVCKREAEKYTAIATE